MLISVAEAARRLGISERTVWRLIAARKVRTVRVSPKTIRMPVAEIERIVAGK